jgi:1-deoxy-D-xylulose-5-phosphate reductoisomerase
MAKGIAIVGSTGSIGTQTLDVVKNMDVSVVALCCNSNIGLIAEQAKAFKPRLVVVGNDDLASRVRGMLDQTIEVLSGTDGIVKACTDSDVDTVVNATVGISGLIPTVRSIEAGKEVALANKESLVTGGMMVMDLARSKGVRITPIDSEHSAVFQCIQGNSGNRIEKIILTASGGPFRGKKRSELGNVTVENALSHPTWKMGSKITIDSATLMNKGFEVMEASYMFGVTPENVQVVVHPQSVVHSAVQFEDASIIAQLGLPDMRIPIQYALNYPMRPKNDLERFDFFGRSLTFERPDTDTFKCLRLAYDALKIGGTAPAALNGANEAAVALFLDKKISFLQIGDTLEEVLNKHKSMSQTLENIQQADRWARSEVSRIVAQ